jgi:hypothetical protein
VYFLDVATNVVRARWFKDQREAASVGPMSGSGDFRRIGGCINNRVGFVGMFADGPSLTLWLDGRQVNALSAEVVVRKDTDVLLRRRFRVFERGDLVCDYRYLYLDHEDVPDVDVFSWFARSLDDMKARIRTWLMLADQLGGTFVSTEEYFRKLTGRVEEVLSKGGYVVSAYRKGHR